MDKDRAIITQVAAKIAADLVGKDGDATAKLGEFAIIFPEITGMLLEKIYDTFNVSDQAPANVVQMVQDRFNGTVVSSGGSTGELSVKGEQFGDLPAWLLTAAKRDGVTLVYDNRDTANATNRRPLFKQVAEKGADAKGYWAPRGR